MELSFVYKIACLKHPVRVLWLGMNTTHKLPGELCLVSVWEGLLDGEDDAVGDDGEQDGVLKGRPLDQELMGGKLYI